LQPRPFSWEFPKGHVADFLVNENAKMTMRPAVRPWRLYDQALCLLTVLGLAAAHSPAQSSNHAGDPAWSSGSTSNYPTGYASGCFQFTAGAAEIL